MSNVIEFRRPAVREATAFEDRIIRIRESLERINNLMEEIRNAKDTNNDTLRTVPSLDVPR